MQRSGEHLKLRDKNEEQPLLLSMSNPGTNHLHICSHSDSCYMIGLAAFPKRILIANTVNDLAVHYESSSLCLGDDTEDNEEVFCSAGITSMQCMITA